MSPLLLVSTLSLQSPIRPPSIVLPENPPRATSRFEASVRYRIAYTPQNPALDGAWRSIEVRIPQHPDLVVRTRRGYYAVVKESGGP